MFVRTQEDVDRYLALVRKAAAGARAACGRPPALTPQQQQEARECRDNGGATLSELAKSYNVGMATISRLSKKVAA